MFASLRGAAKTKGFYTLDLYSLVHEVSAFVQLVREGQVDVEMSRVGGVLQLLLQPHSPEVLHASRVDGHRLGKVRGGRFLFDQNGVDAAVRELSGHG